MDSHIFDLSNYDYQLPKELIAQTPASPRDSSRLLVIKREKTSIEQTVFSDISRFLKPGDVLVLNNTEVIRARLHGENSQGAKIEVLLAGKIHEQCWEVLIKPAKRARPGEILSFAGGRLKASVLRAGESGLPVLDFGSFCLETVLPEIGEVPLPPYIKEALSKPDDYQTVYAAKQGAVAAPTAGLHFTQPLLDSLAAGGIDIVYVTLHCGLPTFRPIQAGDIRNHKIGSEWIELSAETADIINRAKAAHRRIIAVGTTAIRTLETTAFLNQNNTFQVKAFSGQTNLFIVPGYTFKMVDAVITNFHTPCSTNLVLMTAFICLELRQCAYSKAQQEKFRFFSFGDAMLIL